jgi:hypothetical protein
MKKIISSIILMSFIGAAQAQTTATNWTATDCNSFSHTLYSELDSGKIIVFTWVMPCISCKAGAKAAYDAVQSFATSNPGKVRYYLADDLGDASCATLSSWVTSNSVGATSNMTIFSNAGNVISETDFGGTGMPHVVVMAGTDHKIYYNKKNSATYDQPGITAAINEALTALAVDEMPENVTFTLTPNPAKDVLVLSGIEKISKIAIVSVTGKTVKEESNLSGKASMHMSVNGLAAGIYLVKVTDNNGNSGVQKFVKQ